jgi:hypothetical protein
MLMGMIRRRRSSSLKPLYGPWNFEEFPCALGDRIPAGLNLEKVFGRFPVPAYGRESQQSGRAACGSCAGCGWTLYTTAARTLAEIACWSCDATGSLDVARSRYRRTRNAWRGEDPQPTPDEQAREARRLTKLAAHRGSPLRKAA